MQFEIDNKKAIANRGNLFRLKQVMRRAEAGEPVKVGFIGGSITMGCLATEPELCYAYRVYEWWQEKFPKTEVSYINAGIGATTSQFAAARVEKDLLDQKPDVVFVEFSVNDDANEFFMETYESLIRKIYTFDQNTAIIIINCVRYDDGGSAEVWHAKVARYYELPQISMQRSIYPEVAAGRISAEEITADYLHPNDIGHKLVAGVIESFLEEVYTEREQKEAEAEEKAPLTEASYQHAVRYRNDNCDPVITGGWKKDMEKQNAITEVFRYGWTAKEPGSFITFEISGSEIAIQYKKCVKHPAVVAEAVIDGDESQVIKLDANFEETWGDCLFLQTVLRHGKDGKHEVKIRIPVDCGPVAEPFYLASVICSSKQGRA